MVYIQQIDTIWARLYFFPPVATRHPRPTRAHFDRICAAFLQAEDGPDFGFEIDFETRKKNGEEVRRNREEVRKYRADWNTWAYYFGEEEPFPGIDPALSMPDLDAHAQARVQLQSGSQPDSPPRPDSPLLKQLHAVIEQAQAKTEHAQTGEHIHTQAPTEPSDPGLKPDEPPRKEMTKNEAFLTRIVQQRALKRDQKFMDKQVPLGERKLRRDRERDAARSASPKPEAERNEASQRTAERERAGEKEQRGGHTGPGAGAGLGRERAAGYWPERAFERRDQWQYGHHHVDERVREPHRDGSRDLRSGEAGRYQRFRAEEREGEYASGFGNGLARAHHYHDQRRWGGDSYRPRQRDTYRPRDSYRPYSLAEEKTRDWDQRQGRPRDQDGSGGRQ